MSDIVAEPMRVVKAPELKGMTLDEQEEWLRGNAARLFGEGPSPSAELPPLPGRQNLDDIQRGQGGDGGTTPVGAFVPPPVPRTPASDVFDPTADLQAAGYPVERFTMPGGKKVWIHPLSPDEVLYVNRQAQAECRAAGILKPGQEDVARLEWTMRAWVWQAICCCHTGPEPDAPRVFTDAHARTLRESRRYGEALQKIAGICDRLSTGQSETDLMRERLADFFGATESWLKTLRGLCVTDWPTACEQVREEVERFGTFVSSMKRQCGFSE